MPFPRKKKLDDPADRYEKKTRSEGRTAPEGVAPANRGDDEAEHDKTRVRTGEFTREQIERELARRRKHADDQGEGRSAAAPP